MLQHSLHLMPAMRLRQIVASRLVGAFSRSRYRSSAFSRYRMGLTVTWPTAKPVQLIAWRVSHLTHLSVLYHSLSCANNSAGT